MLTPTPLAKINLFHINPAFTVTLKQTVILKIEIHDL
jgi:hypothetical protein